MSRHIRGHGIRHHPHKAKKPERHGAQRHVAVSAYGMLPVYGQGGQTNPPVSGPAPPGLQGPSGHLSPDQFVGYPGGFSTDAGNMTGVAAIEGVAGNGGAGGAGDASAGASGGAAS